jgi:hypothetical protein
MSTEDNKQENALFMFCPARSDRTLFRRSWSACEFLYLVVASRSAERKSA